MAAGSCTTTFAPAQSSSSASTSAGLSRTSSVSALNARPQIATVRWFRSPMCRCSFSNSPILQLQFRQPAIDAIVGFSAGDILQLGKKPQLLAHLHSLVEAALFRQVANAILQGGRHRLAEQFDAAGIGDRDVHDHANSRRLAGAVWSNQAEHAAGPDLRSEERRVGKE